MMFSLKFFPQHKVNSYIWLHSLLSSAAKLISRTAQESHV